MRIKNLLIGVVALLTLAFSVSSVQADQSIAIDHVAVELQSQHTKVAPGLESVLAVKFELEDTWHFYASADTAPGGMNLKVTPEAEGLVFDDLIFPASHPYYDKALQVTVDAFSEAFTVFIPFRVVEDFQASDIIVKVQLEGALCSDMTCTVPTIPILTIPITIDPAADMSKPAFAIEQPDESVSAAKGTADQPNYPMWFALGLALVAGLSLNLMPCVWPILPLVVLRMVDQSQKGKGKSFVAGVWFFVGMLGFFACLAAANIILNLAFQSTLQWGDQFRNPVFVIVMTMIMFVLALFMFDVFTFVVPSSVTNKSQSSSGTLGTIGMGFLAAIMSTPCSFGLLAAAFAWAQSQPLVPATIAILSIGVGMGIPYLVLTAIPGLLQKLPKPGTWMEVFKQVVGFVLLGIAAWMFTVVPDKLQSKTIFLAVIVAFSCWMWGKWVSWNTPVIKRFVVRFIAVLIVAGSAFYLFKPEPKLFDWQPYDADVIEKQLDAGSPVLIKFTADWCLSCKVVEKTVYSREDIADLVDEKGVLMVKADTTTQDAAATRAQKSVYNEPGVPVSILIVPDDEKKEYRWRDKSFGDELKRILQSLEE